MKFIRKQVATLTGIPDQRLATLMRRAQLPVAVDAADLPHHDVADAEESRSWTRFSTFDVIAIAVAEGLMRAGGLNTGIGPESAARIVGSNRGLLGDIARTGPTDRGDRWLGYVSQPVELLSTDGGWGVVGDFPAIAGRIAKASMEFPPPSVVALVNVDLMLREIAFRAEKAGIEFDRALA